MDFAGNMVKYPFLGIAMEGPRGKPKGITAACSLAQWREGWQAGYRLNMTANLLKSLPTDATDKLDKIFALVSLSCDVEESFIDYKKSLRTVLIDLAKDHLRKETPRLDILSMAPMFEHPPNVPSWVVCWTEPRDKTPGGLSFARFSAGKQGIHLPTSPQAYIDSQDALVIHSQPLDTISAILDSTIDTHVPSVPLSANRIIGNPEHHAWFTAMYEHDYQTRTLHLELADLTEFLGLPYRPPN